MTATAVTDFAPALKTLFQNKGEVEDEVYKDNPFLTMIPKGTDYYGDGDWKIPVKYANPNGRSVSFTKAQSSRKPTKLAKWVVTRAKDYGTAEIAGELILACKNDKGALVDALKMEMDGVIQAVLRSTAIKLLQDGSGYIGRLNSSDSVAGTAFTLENPAEIANVEVGQIHTFSATKAATARTGTALVSGVDRDLGVITYSAALNGTVTGVANTDYIQIDGDFNAGITGLDGWNPYTAPTSTTFFGLDRTPDLTRLSGVRMNLTGTPIEEAMVKLFTRVCREGGRPDFGLMNPDRWQDLEIALGSYKQYVDVEVGTFGFVGLKLNTPKGTAAMLSDQNMSPVYARAIQLNTWKFRTLEDFPMVLDLDDLRMLRVSTDDTYEIRVGYYGNVGCKAVGFNGVAKLI